MRAVAKNLLDVVPLLLLRPRHQLRRLRRPFVYRSLNTPTDRRRRREVADDQVEGTATELASKSERLRIAEPSRRAPVTARSWGPAPGMARISHW
jgi:cytochrome c-type biogenesis protein CcmH/NrfG